jgi:hypothetical protein
MVGHLDLDDFHLEYERVTTLDFWRATAITIAKFRGNIPAENDSSHMTRI